MRFVFLFLFFTAYFSQSKAQDFYDLHKIQTIEVYILDTQWRSKLDILKASTEDYLLADSIIINDAKFENVGIKFKGNSSYKPSYAKNPFHIELNTFQKQNYQGYQDIKLSNGFGDPSFVREALAYHVLGAYMDAPKCNFAKLYINNEYIGLYTNTESINSDFVEDKFGSKSNTFIKANPILNPSPANKCNLKYKGSDTSLYTNFYELKSDLGWKDLVNLCDTVSNKTAAIEAILDMDKAIWMLAFNALLVNLDSYTGAFCQNYYLYKTDAGKFVPIVWDLNMSFGAFPFAGGPSNSMGNLSVLGMQQLPPNIHETHDDWPLIQAVFSNPRFKKSFYAHFKTMLNNHFDTGYYKQVFVQLQDLVRADLQADANKFFGMSDFQNAADSTIRSGNFMVPGVFQLMEQRISYLKTLPELSMAAPQIAEVKPSTENPIWNQQVNINARVVLAGTGSVFIHYKRTKWAPFELAQMFDDGMHGDGMAGDQVFGASFTMSSPFLYYYIYAENANAAQFSPQQAAFTFYTLQVNAPEPAKGVLVINEFLASNKKSDINEYGAYEDWIELYNNSNLAIDLSGFQISDNFNNSSKYVFPIGTRIEANAYLMLWADDMPSTAKYLHTGFALSATGEELILSSALGRVLDSISFGSQETDKPTGRCPNGIGSFTQISKASFNDANIFCATGNTEVQFVSPNVYLYPNPSNGAVFLHNPTGLKVEMELFNLQGKLVKLVNSSSLISLEELSDACYFVVFKDVNGAFIRSQKLIIYK